jgi:CheY-like chemotaxis protein
MADFWVLIVDDEDGVLSVLKNSLRKLGDQFRVSTATGGEDAMDMLIQRKYDLVVTDYKMAGMNGLELLEKVHAIRPETRVILMTAYGSAAVESEAARLQAYRYLPKPLEIESFRRIVREAAGDALPDASGILVLSEKDYRDVDRILCQLQGDVAARCILMADGEGRCLARAGNTEYLDLTQLASLLGGSMTTLGEAGKAVTSPTARASSRISTPSTWAPSCSSSSSTAGRSAPAWDRSGTTPRRRPRGCAKNSARRTCTRRRNPSTRTWSRRCSGSCRRSSSRTGRLRDSFPRTKPGLPWAPNPTIRPC